MINLSIIYVMSQCAKTSKAECLNNCIKLLELPIPFTNSPRQSMVLIGHDLVHLKKMWKPILQAHYPTNKSYKFVIILPIHASTTSKNIRV